MNSTMNSALLKDRKLSHRINQRFNRWLSRRIPANNKQSLHKNNIFILPTRFGLAYLLFVFILFLLATNYQNNLIMLLSYLMASLFITGMMHSFFNLSGLKFEAKPISYAHENSSLYFLLTLTSTITRYDINVQFEHQNNVHLSQCAKGDTSFELPFFAHKRGRLSPGRVKISSEYCLGLFSTWTHCDFQLEGVVYPKVKSFDNIEAHLSYPDQNPNNSSSMLLPQGDDFYELKNYIVGEPLSRVAWKQLAKGQGWLSKHHSESKGDTVWLNLDNMPVNDIETKLQLLCFFSD